MLYIGMDVHKEFCQACVIDEHGRVRSNEKFSSTQDELDRFLAGFKNAKFVLESTGIWEFIYEGIERRGFEVQLAHPLKVRAIAEARVKTDKVDAETAQRFKFRTSLTGEEVMGKERRFFLRSLKIQFGQKRFN